MRNGALISGGRAAVLASVVFFAGLSSSCLGGESDLEARVKALEKRVGELEKALAEREAEIGKLRERLGEAETGPSTAPDLGGDDEAIDSWREQLGRLDEEMRRELERLGLDWGLPGRSFRRLPGTIDLMPARSAFLGIRMQEGERGVEVAGVVPDSPAERAGFEPGDLIVSIDGQDVSTAQEVAEIVGARQPGDAVAVTVERDRRRLTLSATLAAPPRRGGRGPRVPRFRFGGRGLGASPRIAPKGEAGARDTDSISLDVEVAGGRARVELSAPGLFLSDELAERLGLTERERRDVEKALAAARNELVKRLADKVREGAGHIDAATVAKMREEAEASARELLAGKLPEAKLSALELAQAEAGSRSSLSVSVHAGLGDAGRKGLEEQEDSSPFESLFDRAERF